MSEFPYQRDLRYICVLVVAFILLKMPTLNLPIYHDETYVVAAGWDILHNGFWPIPREAQTFGHTPLAFEFVALAFLLFGPLPLAVHLVSVSLAVVTLYFTYLIGKTLWGDAVGVVAATMLAACPLFFAQAGIGHLDLPATMFAIVAIYGLCRDQWLTYILGASLMVLSKEPTVILIPLMAGYAWLKGLQLPARTRLKHVILGGVPLLTFSLWLIFHNAQAGYWWGSPVAIKGNTEIIRMNLEMGILKRFVIRGIQVLWSGHHFAIALIFALAGAKALYTHGMRKSVLQAVGPVLLHRPAEVFMAAAVVSFLLFHSIFGFLHTRYLLPIFPLLFLLATRSLTYLLGRRTALGLSLTLPVLVAAWFLPPDRFSPPESNLDYMDIVKAHQGAAAYLENHHRGRIILASEFQAAVNLTVPYFGYVKEPLKVSAIGPGFEPGRMQEPPFDLVYFSPTDQFAEKVKAVIMARQLREGKRFTSGRHSVALYW